LQNPSARLTRDGRTLVLAGEPPEPERSGLFAKIEEWFLPAQDSAPMAVRALDVETGQSLGEASIEETADHWLTDDGHSLLTIYSENSSENAATTIRCWDMPPRKPLCWVLVVPPSLGIAFLALLFGWRRLRRWARCSAPKADAALSSDERRVNSSGASNA
jgi:hypothetical protein